jgi:molybdenum cofactor cytidylyltransferase
MSTNGVAGLLLAAGTSARMGRNKMLLDLGGETVLRRAARRAIDGGLHPLIVVLGAQAARAEHELGGLECQVATNPHYESGMTSSMHCGLAALPTTTAAAMVLLADMPFVTADMIGEMVRRYQQTAARLVISDYEGVNAPPMLFDKHLFGELQATHGERCGREVVQRHLDDAEVFRWPASALADLDVPEDYERLTHAG